MSGINIRIEHDPYVGDIFAGSCGLEMHVAMSGKIVVDGYDVEKDIDDRTVRPINNNDFAERHIRLFATALRQAAEHLDLELAKRQSKASG